MGETTDAIITDTIGHQNQTNSDSETSQVPKSPLRGGVPQHQFTQEERSKGGSVTSPIKTASNKWKALKHGKRSTGILKCNSCPDRLVCNWYEDKSPCKMQVQAIRDIMKIHTGGPDELFKEINKTLQHLKLRILSNPDDKTLTNYAKLLMDYKSSRYGDRYFTVSMDLSSYLSEVMERYDKNKKPSLNVVNAEILGVTIQGKEETHEMPERTVQEEDEESKENDEM